MAAERHKKRSFLLRRPWRFVMGHGRTGVGTPSQRDESQSTAMGTPIMNSSNSSRSRLRPWPFGRRESGRSTISLPSSALISGLMSANHIARMPVLQDQQLANPTQVTKVGDESSSSPGLAATVGTVGGGQRDDYQPLPIHKAPHPIAIKENAGPSTPLSEPTVRITSMPKPEDAPNKLMEPGQVKTERSIPTGPLVGTAGPQLQLPPSSPVGNPHIPAGSSSSSSQLVPMGPITAGPSGQQTLIAGPAAATVTTLSRSLSIPPSSPVGNSPNPAGPSAGPSSSSLQVQLQPITAGPPGQQTLAAGPAASTVTTPSRSLSVSGQAQSLSRKIVQSGVQNDISSTIDTLQKAFQHAKQRQRKFKNRHGQEVLIAERIGQILRGMQDYAKIVDIAIQHNPEITALVWAGVRSILMVSPSPLLISLPRSLIKNLFRLPFIV